MATADAGTLQTTQGIFRLQGVFRSSEPGVFIREYVALGDEAADRLGFGVRLRPDANVRRVLVRAAEPGVPEADEVVEITYHPHAPQPAWLLAAEGEVTPRIKRMVHGRAINSHALPIVEARFRPAERFLLTCAAVDHYAWRFDEVAGSRTLLLREAPLGPLSGVDGRELRLRFRVLPARELELERSACAPSGLVRFTVHGEVLEIL